MRIVVVAAFLGFSAVNSLVLSLSEDVHSLSGLVGAADDTSFPGCIDCKTTPVEKPECLHSGSADPCSSITCIKNVRQVPSCTPGASGKACVMKDGNQGTQTNFDEPCSGNGGWEVTVYQTGGKCQPQVQTNQRCKTTTACGAAGTGYASVPRTGLVCK